MTSNYNNQIYKDLCMLEERCSKLEKELKLERYAKQLLQQQYNRLQKSIDKKIEKAIYSEKQAIEERDKIIEEKDKEIARLKNLLNIDGTNSGIPTSKTLLNKSKVIPNSREKTGRSIGGQVGHKKHKLEKFHDEEITEYKDIILDECPECHGEIEDTGKVVSKDETDYKITVIKRRYNFKIYKCKCCGKEVRQEIPKELKEENQYGPCVKTLALELMNEGNVPINKVRKIINGLTNEEITLSEGYIAKLQKGAYKSLEKFDDNLKKEVIKLKQVYWDDGVIFVDTKRACLRFYGNEKIAYYRAHEKKDKDGIDEDGILNTIDSSTIVMHDHNKVNYNDEYTFINIECNAHLQRDLQKVVDNLNHNWAKEIKKLISETMHKRKQLIEKGLESDIELQNHFFSEYERLVLEGKEENEKDQSAYYANNEKNLLLRILEYKDNYFAWVVDFTLPTTNNLSERGLRGTKTKMKVSGQFRNLDAAKYYARIKSYIETANRNNINPFNALLKLCLNVPFETKEILDAET